MSIIHVLVSRMCSVFDVLNQIMSVNVWFEQLNMSHILRQVFFFLRKISYENQIFTHCLTRLLLMFYYSSSFCRRRKKKYQIAVLHIFILCAPQYDELTKKCYALRKYLNEIVHNETRETLCEQ